MLIIVIQHYAFVTHIIYLANQKDTRERHWRTRQDAANQNALGINFILLVFWPL